MFSKCDQHQVRILIVLLVCKMNLNFVVEIPPVCFAEWNYLENVTKNKIKKNKLI